MKNYCFILIAIFWLTMHLLTSNAIRAQLKGEPESIRLMRKLYKENLNLRFNSVIGALSSREKEHLKGAVSSVNLAYSYVVDKRVLGDENFELKNKDRVYYRLFEIINADELSLNIERWDEELALIGTMLPNDSIKKLRSDKSFTIFAPTNSAIAKQEQLLKKLEDIEEFGKVAELANLHIVEGMMTGTKLQKLNSVKSINGMTLTVNADDDGLLINEAKIIKTIQCSNGVIHVIDSLLLPRYAIAKTIASERDFRKLAKAINASGLSKRLEGKGPFALFAPTDRAFDKLPYGAFGWLLKPENKEKLADILMVHIVEAGDSLKGVSKLTGASVLNASKTGFSKNINCTNGVIHVIDSVIVPSGIMQELEVWSNNRIRLERLSAIQRREKAKSDSTQKELRTTQRSKEIAELREFLEAASISMSEEGLKDFLNPTVEAVDLEVAKELIQQLDSKRYSERQNAEESLLNLPKIPVDLLQKTLEQASLEKTVRIRRILKLAAPQQIKSIHNALKAIELLRLTGFTKDIYQAVANYHKQDKTIVQSAKRTIAAVVTKQDIPFLISKMSLETPPELRELSVFALRRLENGSLADKFEAWSQKKEFKDVTRSECVFALADLGDRRSLKLLFELMVNSNSASVRARSQLALKKLTGKAFEYSAYARPKIRKKQAEAWKNWITVNGERAQLFYPLRSAFGFDSYGYTLITREGFGNVLLYDEAGTEVWSFKRCRGPNMAQLMENGNILIAEWYGNYVTEVTPEKKIVREYPVQQPCSARPLKNGNILITAQGLGRAIEVDPEGEIVWALNGNFRDAIRMENGNTLLTGYRDGLYIVSEVDPAGASVWEYKRKEQINRIQPLKNERVLITGHSNDVTEVDKTTNSIVWEIIDKKARDAYRRENGNTLIRQYGRVIEVDRKGKIIWSKANVRRWLSPRIVNCIGTQVRGSKYVMRYCFSI